VKYTILFLLATLTCYDANTQIAKASVIKLSYGAQRSMRNIYPGQNGTCYVLMTKKAAVSTMWSKEAISLVKLDENLEIIKEISLDFTKYSFTKGSTGIWLVSNASYETFAIWTEYSDNEVIFYSCPLENTSDKKKIGSIKVLSVKNIDGIGVLPSTGRKSYSITVFENQKDISKTHIALLDESFEILWKHTTETDREIYSEDHIINEQGACLHMYMVVTENGKKELPTYSMLYTLIGSDGTVARVSKDITEEYVSSTMLSFENTLSSCVYGKHETIVSVRKKGSSKNQSVKRDAHKIYSYEFDGQKVAFASMSSDKISRTKIETLIGKSESFIKLRSAFIMKDSSILIMAITSDDRDGRFVTSYDHPISGYHAPGTSQSMAFHNAPSTRYKNSSSWYSGILAIQVDKNREAIKTKSFEINMAISDLWLMDLNPKQIDDDIYFTYMSKNKDNNLVKLQIQEGKLKSSRQIFEKEEMQGRAVVPLTTSKGESGILYSVLNHPLKQARVLKLEVE
jgi:hypothetical protein